MIQKLIVSPAPHISKRISTRSVMLDVIIALVPAMIAAVVYFREYAVNLIFTCVVSAVLTEQLCNLVRRKTGSLGDLSAVVTGLILAFSLPPAIPPWAAAVGSAFSIAIGKMVFGGLGSNIFNPAMVGRAFLTACFGMLMTTWTVPATIDPAMPKIAPSMPDTITQATPLAWSKQAIKATRSPGDKNAVTAAVAEKQLKAAFLGEMGGCLGETCVPVLVIGGVYLLIRGTIGYQIPAGMLGSSFVIATVFNLMNPNAYASGLFHLCAGGVMLGAFFIATDPVTAPLTGRGRWVFGVGAGAIVMLIRIVGEYPEGVMYAVLLMNAVTPLIDRFCEMTPAGGTPSA